LEPAHVYGRGDSERVVGQWVPERRLRDSIVVIGKGPHPNEDRRHVTPFDITSDLFDSLGQFQFDYIDLYLLHRDDPSVPVRSIVDVLNEHHQARRIHAFGGSNWTAERIQEANAYAHENALVPLVATAPISASLNS
jgi:aryl-alcohol dehydrogenase-like predicted oxidoreductase